MSSETSRPSSSVEWIEVTGHAADRWHERTSSPGVGPIVAWNEAHPVNGTGLVADEVRYHPNLDVLLLRNDVALVTVIDVTTARRRVKRAVGLEA